MFMNNCCEFKLKTTPGPGVCISGNVYISIHKFKLFMVKF